MFIIVDFKYTAQQHDVATTKFNDTKAIIDFVAEKSKEHKDFEIVRINEYKDGRLYPMDLVVTKGRLEVLPIPTGEGFKHEAF